MPSTPCISTQYTCTFAKQKVKKEKQGGPRTAASLTSNIGVAIYRRLILQLGGGRANVWLCCVLCGDCVRDREINSEKYGDGMCVVAVCMVIVVRW